jgi:hypothetical protein
MPDAMAELRPDVGHLRLQGFFILRRQVPQHGVAILSW